MFRGLVLNATREIAETLIAGKAVPAARKQFKDLRAARTGNQHRTPSGTGNRFFRYDMADNEDWETEANGRKEEVAGPKP